MLATLARRYTGIGIECHDLAYGYARRPLSRVERSAWSRLIAHWMRSGRLYAAEVKGVAEELGRDPMRPSDDEGLRLEFARRLRAIGETRPRPSPEALREGRIRNLARS